MKKYLLYISFILMSFAGLKAQQLPQYSQYMFNYYAINPAFAGVNANWEVVSNNRYQWLGITDAPRTYTFSAYGSSKDRKMGFGGYVYTDIVGPTRRLGVQGSYSYHINLTEGIRLGFGLSGGINQWSVDAHKIVTNETGDPIFDNGIVSSLNPDLKFGLWLYHKNWHFGFSAPHLLRKRMYFFDGKDNSLNVMKDHYFFNAGYTFELHEDWKLEASAMLKYVFPVPPKTDMVVRGIYKDMLWLGVGYRTRDAMIFMAGYQYNDFLRIGYSYDYTTTDLVNYNSGSHELVLSILFAKYDNGTAKPLFD